MVGHDVVDELHLVERVTAQVAIRVEFLNHKLEGDFRVVIGTKRRLAHALEQA